MHSPSRLFSVRAVRRVFSLGVLVVASTVFAGPPLICRPYDIGVARSLPGGTDGHGITHSYDRTHLVADTLALLQPDMPVIVRMETLRRAAVYATNGLRKWDRGDYSAEDRALGLGLLAKLQERTKAASGDTRTLALFDAGFFAETLRQTNMDPKVDGFPLLTEAAQLRPADDEIAFAVAIASAYPERKEHRGYLARARAAAQPGSLLAANVQSHFGPS
jgi:hypothetical protein